jgi:hypothetical protein
VQNVIGTDEFSAPRSEPAPPATVVAPAAPATVVAPAPMARVVVPRRPCQITFGGMVASEPPRVEVHAWLEKLDALTASMTDGQVLIEAVDRGRHERQYRVRMSLTLSTGVVVVDYDHPNNAPHEDVFVAIRNAFRAARRQLEAHVQALGAVTTG